ncbi:MAG: hypothetical protein ABJH06_16355 [Paraglaciecola sp.]|uniref:hypothetical protein n=1 Tax=Paraglaciecola sp. TaxID=1920173 RepID=UPI0032990F55
MQPQTSVKTYLPANVRVMIALVASPTLLVVGMLVFTLFTKGWREVSTSMIIFTLLSVLAYYIVIVGNFPKFKRSISTSSTDK